MSQTAEIILEGSYQYFDKGVNFSNENFKLVHETAEETYSFHAEVLSRIETGEFLKILVRYEMNSHFYPTLVKIEKSIGSKYAVETFEVDATNLELHYSFQNSHQTEEFKKNISAKHYISSPALCTAGVFTLSKKFDATGRTPVTLLSSENEWIYSAPPSEKIIWADYKTKDLDFELRGKPLSASHLCLFENDALHAGQEVPVELFVSKHYSVPYRLVHGTLSVEINKLKRNTL